MSLSNCFRNFLDSWLDPAKPIYFIRPNARLFNTTNKMAASKLTASHTEGTDHFYLREIKDVKDHVDSTTVCSIISNYLQSILTRRLIGPRNLFVFIKECGCQIVKRRCRLRYHLILNETGVRYVYGDSIAEMLVGLNYSMQFEECVETSETAVSPMSRTDYCCWKLFKNDSGCSLEVCVTVLETKHKNVKQCDTKSIAQRWSVWSSITNASTDQKHRSKARIPPAWMKKLLH